MGGGKGEGGVLGVCARLCGAERRPTELGEHPQPPRLGLCIPVAGGEIVLTSCYRYEKPQAGRLRELHQFGVEMFGAAEPLADAQIIVLALSAFKRLGLEDVGLQINSIGCPTCRKEYHKALKEYVTERKDQLCDTCLSRPERNPMRILDCKTSECQEVSQGAPKLPAFLFEDSRDLFA